MDKKIKYVGSAVAAALMVASAPIIVPMLEPTQEVYAYASPITNPYMTAKEMLEKFKAQFDDRYVSSSQTISSMLDDLVDEGNNGYYYFSSDPLKANNLFDLQRDDKLGKLKDKEKEQDPEFFQDKNKDYYYYDIHGYVSLSDANGSLNTDTPSDLKKVEDGINDGSIVFPMKVTIHLIQGNDGDYNPPSLQGIDDSLKTFSFNVNLSRFDINEDSNIPQVAVGSMLSDSNLQTGKDELLVTDNYSNNGSDQSDMARTPIYGKSLFTSRQSAINYAQVAAFNTDSTDSGDSGATDSSGKITKSGTYYQTVSFKLDNGKDDAIKYMISGQPDELDSEGVVQPYNTYINGETTKATNNSDYVYNKTADVITIVRPILVSDTLYGKLASPSVGVGTAIDDPTLDDETNNKLADDLGNVFPTTVSFDHTYYLKQDLTGDATANISDGKFSKAGTYYRRVTFTFKSGDASELSLPGGTVSEDKKQVTYVQAINVKNGVTTTINNPKVTIDESDTSQNSTSGNDVLASDGSSIVNKDYNSDGFTNGVKFGTNYYKDGATTNDVLNDNATPVSGVVDDGSFAKEGDYLRTITFYLVGSAIDTNNFGTDSTTYKTDSTNGTVTYVQKVHVGPLSSVNVNYGSVELMAGATTDDPALANIDGDTLTFGTDKTNLIDTTKGSNKNGIDFGQQYFKTLSNGKLSDPVTDFSEAGTYYRTIKFYVNKDVDSINFNGTTGTTDSSDNSVTFIQTINVEPIETAVNFNVPSVSIGATSTSDINALNDTTTDTLKTTDDAATSLIDTAQGKNGISFGTDYYTDMGLKNKATNGLSTGSGTYYRKITFYLNRGTSELSFDKTPYDKTSNSVTFIQPVSVNVATVVEKIDTVSSSIGSSVSSAVLGDNDLTSNKVSIVDTTQTSVGNEYFTRAEDAVKGENSQGTSFKSSGKVYRTITFTLKNPASYYSFDGTEGTDYKIDGNKITFAQAILINTATAVPKLSTESVQNGSLISDSEKASNDLTVNGSSIVATNGVSYGTDYYSVADNKPADILNGQGKAASGVTDGTNFTKSGDYYRVITFALNQNVDANSYAFGDGKLSSDGKSVQYVQEVRVLANSTMVNIPNIITNTGALTTEFDDKT